MNIIHSSSLAFYPVGRKPNKVVGPENSLDQKQNPNANQAAINRQSQGSPKTSSIAEIQAALSENGLTVVNSDLPSNSRVLKALNTYTENRNQTTKQRVADAISGIDLYV